MKICVINLNKLWIQFKNYIALQKNEKIKTRRLKKIIATVKQRMDVLDKLWQQ